MRRRYTEEQIAYAMRQAEAGSTAPEICRKMGISEQAFHRWKRKYAGLGVPELREDRPVRLGAGAAVEIRVSVAPAEVRWAGSGRLAGVAAGDISPNTGRCPQKPVPKSRFVLPTRSYPPGGAAARVARHLDVAAEPVGRLTGGRSRRPRPQDRPAPTAARPPHDCSQVRGRVVRRRHFLLGR